MTTTTNVITSEQSVPSSADGTLLHVTKYTSSNTSTVKAQLLVVHGYLEYGQRYHEFAATMVNSYNIAVTVFDLRGHGRSGGSVRAGISNWQHYLDDVDTVLKTMSTDVPIFVLGHSTGGLIMMEWLLASSFVENKKSNIQGMLITSPFLAPSKHIPWIKKMAARMIGPYFGFVPVPAELTAADLSNDVEKQAEHDADTQLLHWATVGWGHLVMQAQDRVAQYLAEPERVKTAVSLMPLWLAYAEQDRVADPVASKAAFETLKRAAVDKDSVTIVGHPEDMHELFNDVHRKDWFAQVGTWIQGVVDTKK